MTPPEPAPPAKAHADQERSLRAGVLIGLVSGLTGIMCCVSPVIAVLIGIASAAQAVTLGDTLYYSYGWYFRGAGLIVAAIAVVLYLRQRNACSLDGAYRYRLLLLALLVTALATYAALFWFTKWLGIRFGPA